MNVNRIKDNNIYEDIRISKHSKSLLYTIPFEALGLDHVYMAFEVEDDKLKDTLEASKVLGSKAEI